jgi:hypothetical protein
MKPQAGHASSCLPRNKREAPIGVTDAVKPGPDTDLVWASRTVWSTRRGNSPLGGCTHCFIQKTFLVSKGAQFSMLFEVRFHPSPDNWAP